MDHFAAQSPSPARRRFLTRLGIASAAIGALFGSPRAADAQPAPSARKHETDDWMDQLPRAHRMVFDAVSADGARAICQYASNFFAANRSGYGLEPRDIGVLIIVRHKATPFGYNDAMWAKYGSVFATEMKLDASSATANPATSGPVSLDTLAGQGAHVGVCAMSTRRFAGVIARSTGESADAVFDTLGKNLIKNAHLTPAGIVAVGRAQERGYAFGYAE